jgi:hemerythrin
LRAGITCSSHEFKLVQEKGIGMSLITWRDEFSVGVAEIDTQHKHLVNLINQLHDAMRVGKGKDIMDKVLDELIAYTQTHFRHEERLMQTRGYSELAGHQAEHNKLTQQALDYQQQFRAGKIAMTLPLMNFLKDWLTTHILTVDHKYKSCLAQ